MVSNIGKPTVYMPLPNCIYIAEIRCGAVDYYANYFPTFKFMYVICPIHIDFDSFILYSILFLDKNNIQFFDIEFVPLLIKNPIWKVI